MGEIQEVESADMSYETLCMLFLLIISQIGSHYLNRSPMRIVFQSSSFATVLGIIAGIVL